MKTDFLPHSVLKISVLTLAITAASFSTTTVMAAECQLASGNAGGAVSFGTDALACGPFTSAFGNNATAVGQNAVAANENDIAIGNTAIAAFNNAISIGANSQADGIDAVALGGGVSEDGSRAGAQALGNSTTAIGGESIANGAGATAIGWQSTASAERAQAFGHLASATGVRSTAVGEAAAAGGLYSIAIGNQSSAANDNQIAIGGAGQLQASTASQTGSTNIVTTDANGTLGTSVSVTSLATVNQLANTNMQVSDLRSQYNRQEERLDEAEDGIAMALALETPVIPSGKRYAMTIGTGYYNGGSALSTSFASRLSDTMSISAGAGVGLDTGKVGARGGVTFAW